MECKLEEGPSARNETASLVGLVKSASSTQTGDGEGRRIPRSTETDVQSNNLGCRHMTSNLSRKEQS